MTGTEEADGKRAPAVRRMVTWRVLRTELLRGTAPVAALAFAGTGAGTLFNETEDWAGRWGPLAEYIRVILIVLVPLAVAAGAWQAGRDRRRRTGELLGSISRPAWQRVLVAWVAVTAGMWMGLLLAWLAGAVLVARVATYGGHGWWWTLAVAFAGLAAASALGVAIGSVLPGRLVAPVAGILAFAGMGVLSYAPDDGVVWLVPTLTGVRSGIYYLPTGFQVTQLVWFVGLAAMLLILGAARRRWLAAAPGAVALVAAVPLVTGPVADRWQQDPEATELVCADDDGAEVCLTRVNAFLLDDAVGPVREQLTRWEGVDGGFVRAVDRLSYAEGEPAPDGTAVLILDWLVSWDGGLSEESEYGETIETIFAQAAGDAVIRNCDPYRVRSGREPGEPLDPGERPMVEATEVAHDWVLGDTHAIPVQEGEPLPSEILLEWPEAKQKEWMGRYMTTAQTCDRDIFTELMGELR